MKICAYKFPCGLSRLGIFRGEDCVLDPNMILAARYQTEGRYNYRERADRRLPSSLYELLDTADDPVGLLREAEGTYEGLVAKGYGSNPGDLPLTVGLGGDVSLAKPLDKINTYRDFYAHESHVEKGFQKRGEKIPPAWYEMPVYYKGGDRRIYRPRGGNFLAFLYRPLGLRIGIGNGGGKRGAQYQTR